MHYFPLIDIKYLHGEWSIETTTASGKAIITFVGIKNLIEINSRMEDRMKLRLDIQICTM